MDATGVVDVRLDSAASPPGRRGWWKGAATLGLLGLLAALALTRREGAVDPPYFAPTWLPAELSTDPSGLTFDAGVGRQAEVTYGHKDPSGDFDRYVILQRNEKTWLDTPETTPDRPSLSVVATRVGSTVWQDDRGAQDDGFFVGYVQTPHCAGAATSVWAYRVDRARLFEALLAAECDGEDIRIDVFDSIREVCRRSENAVVWNLDVENRDDPQQPPFLQIYALEGEGCSLAASLLPIVAASRERFEGRETMVILDGQGGDAYFRSGSLTIVVRYGDGKRSDARAAPDLRRILEGLRQVKVNSNGKIADS